MRFREIEFRTKHTFSEHSKLYILNQNRHMMLFSVNQASNREMFNPNRLPWTHIVRIVLVLTVSSSATRAPEHRRGLRLRGPRFCVVEWRRALRGQCGARCLASSSFATPTIAS